MTALKNRNLKDVLHYLETEDTDAYKFLTDLNLESYSIVEEIEVYGSAMKYVVQLDITGSGSDLFPVGKSMWEVGVEEPEAGNGGITLFKPVTNKINRIKYDKQSKDIDFCADFFELLEPYVISASDLNKMVPDIKDAEPYNDFCESLIIFLRRYGLPEENTPADSVMAEAKRVLGITEIDLKNIVTISKVKGQFLPGVLRVYRISVRWCPENMTRKQGKALSCLTTIQTVRTC